MVFNHAPNPAQTPRLDAAAARVMAKKIRLAAVLMEMPLFFSRL